MKLYKKILLLLCTVYIPTTSIILANEDFYSLDLLITDDEEIEEELPQSLREQLYEFFNIIKSVSILSIHMAEEVYEETWEAIAQETFQKSSDTLTFSQKTYVGGQLALKPITIPISFINTKLTELWHSSRSNESLTKMRSYMAALLKKMSLILEEQKNNDEFR